MGCEGWKEGSEGVLGCGRWLGVVEAGNGVREGREETAKPTGCGVWGQGGVHWVVWGVCGAHVKVLGEPHPQECAAGSLFLLSMGE